MEKIYIEGPIGDAWTGGFTAKDIRQQLAKVAPGQSIEVHINSPGGSVSEGFAIYNALRDSRAKITTIIDGAAWSIASFIAIAGSRVIARPASSIMIHDAWGVTIGNAEDHIRSADALDKLSETMASMYAERMKLENSTVREMMKSETWLSPEEAAKLGFVDAIEDGGATGPAQNAAIQWAEHAKRMGYLKFDAFAARYGGSAAAGSKEPDPPKERTMNDKDQLEQAAPPAAAQVNQTEAAQGQAPNHNEVNAQIDKVLAAVDERLGSFLAKLEQRRGSGPLPLAGFSAEDDTLERHLRGKSPKEKKEWLLANWSDLKNAYPLRLNPQAANTYNTTPTGALVPAIVSSTALTVLQHRLAQLSSFARNVQAGRIGRNTVQVPIAVAAGTTLTNPTNFENTTAAAATISNRPVTPNHISTLLHMDYGELENGYQLAWITEIKAAEFADAIIQQVNAVLNTTNFTGQNKYAKLAADWTAEDLKIIWSRLSKAPTKNIILSEEYYRVHLPDNLESFNPLAGNTMPGWDGFFLQTNWTGAGANVRGFACNPQAVVIAAGLPVSLPDVPNRPISYILTIEKIGMQVEVFEWFSPASRTQWMSFDAMFGAGLGDASAGVIIRNAAP